MAIYKLDETPNIFISPYFYDKFVYRMVHHIDESNYSFIRDINLRKDKLVIHGTEINETTGSKLSDSLHLRQKTGKLFVNCDGACYIYVIDKGTYRPIDNVIFDWSPFGVTVPNSVNDVLRKELHQKEQKLSAMSAGLSSTKGEVEDEIGKQLMTSRKNEQDKEMVLQKLYCQLSVKEFELEATKNMFGLSKKEVKTLKEHLSSSKKENTDAKTRQMQDGFSSVQGVLQSIKTELESSNKNIKDIKEMVKQNQVIVTELRKIQNEISSGNSELQLTKRQLESSGKKVIELEEELSACKMEGKAKEVELHKMKMELESVKILLELAGKKAEDDSFGDCNAIIKVIEIVE